MRQQSPKPNQKPKQKRKPGPPKSPNNSNGGGTKVPPLFPLYTGTARAYLGNIMYNSMTIPYVVENTGHGERSYDIYSRLMKDRIVLLGTEINDAVASVICAQLLFLESQDAEKTIYMYINSPGGSVTAGMAIFDTMRYITAPVATLCMGRAASMGALLLSAGEKGMRYALPNSQIMIHQPLGGYQGQATDIDIHTKEILRMKKKLTEILTENTGQPIARVRRDTERDCFMTADEARAYGLIDNVLTSRRDLASLK